MTPYLALRIDVETLPGLVYGLPVVLRTLEDRGIRGTVFVPTGPDRSGLALARVVQGAGRLRQMLRLRPAAGQMLVAFMAGIAVPVRAMSAGLIGARRWLVGHEVAVHGHDHWLWIHRCRTWPQPRVALELARGIIGFSRALDHAPSGFGAPGWVTTPPALQAIDGCRFPFSSDCRGSYPFLSPGSTTPQLPTTLPTLEEAVRQGQAPRAFPQRIDGLLDSAAYHCYCAHAEVEGMRFPEMLPRLLDQVQGKARVGPLGAYLVPGETLPTCPVRYATVPGRFDAVTIQVTR